MKILLDENLPHDLRHFIPGHNVFTVAYMGWRGVENGELLAKAAVHGFDAVITQDAGIEYEQNLAALPTSVVIVEATSNAMDDLRPLVPALLKTLESLQPRTLSRVSM
jgi:predicted nuclease of predicted toxin-antitoxin system